MHSVAAAAEHELPPVLRANPDLDRWVRIDLGGTVTVFTGKVELGQGIATAIARIGAEELDVAFERVRVQTADTEHGLNEFYTAGSQSMKQSGSALRQAAAEARLHLLELAAARLSTSAATLSVQDGRVSAPDGKSVTYWDLMAGKRFERDATGRCAVKAASLHSVVGHRSAPRSDLLGIVTGASRYVHDLSLPGMLHGRVLRPPGPGARLLLLDDAAVRAMPGVVGVVRDGSFVGVLAEGEDRASAAVDALRARARWSAPTQAPPPASQVGAWLLGQETQSFLVVDGTPTTQPPSAPPAPTTAEHTLESTFTRPYLMHASIGPSAAMALWEGGRLTVWSHSQGVYVLRGAIADALGLDVANVRAVHVIGAGCYGHNGADDAAFDATLLARAAPGRAVLLKWTRADEHKWEPFGAPGVARLQASLDQSGQIIDWRHEVWGNTHVTRSMPGRAPSLLAGPLLDPPVECAVPAPLLVPEAGIHRNATPIYTLPRMRIVKHFVAATPIRTSSLRSLGAWLNVFAIESFMDELADACDATPIEFRLRHLADPRARAVIEAAVEVAGWSGQRSDAFGRGTGIGFARYKNGEGYAAVVAALRVEDETAEILVDRVTVAADVGEIVDPSGVENQLEGGVVQSISWALKEAVAFDAGTVTSDDWDSYPIIRFPEVPEIQTVLLDRPGEPFLGCGEVTMGPTVAAVANAVRDAIGHRLRDTPFTPARVRDAVLAG